VVGPAPLGYCSVPGPPNLYVAKLSPDGTSLVYSGCIGGSGFNYPGAIAVDDAGNAYVAGVANSPDFPLVNPLPFSPPPAQQGPPKVFLFKLGPDGTLLYSTLFGGSNGDNIQAIAADPAGNIYLTGHTNSPDFPIKNALEPRPPSAYSSFVAKINAAGSDLVYSTYWGGANFDSPAVIAADSLGNTYLAGSTTSGNLRTTPDALQSKPE
jgi:beta-propeller repeat-containing protein